jgi:phosphoribosylformylglycinamidine synthase
MFVAEVRVMLKPSVNDPQGLSIRNALRSLSFAVDGVRAGKVIVVRFEAEGPEEAQAATDAMCQKLLANPVIETYEFSVNEAAAEAAALVP